MTMVERNLGEEQDKMKGHNANLPLPKILPKDRLKMQQALRKPNKD